MNKHFTRAALCLAVVASLLAAGCNDNDAATQAPPSAEQTRLAAMIDALVSTNTPPEDGGLGLSDLVTEPPGWSREEDARVWQAFAEIVNAGPAIVPYLIENLDRTFPGCRARLCEDDHIRADIAVSVDGEIGVEGMRQQVGAESEIHFLPALSGG